MEIWPPKSPDFKCSWISNGWVSDPHCNRYFETFIFYVFTCCNNATKRCNWTTPLAFCWITNWWGVTTSRWVKSNFLDIYLLAKLKQNVKTTLLGSSKQQGKHKQEWEMEQKYIWDPCINKVEWTDPFRINYYYAKQHYIWWRHRKSSSWDFYPRNKYKLGTCITALKQYR